VGAHFPRDTRATSLLSGRGLPATPALSAIQDRLAPDTLLIEYHAFDDEVVGWAVDRGHARMERIPFRTALLAAHVRRFVRAVADPTTEPVVRASAAEPLEELLGRFAPEIERHERIVVVPHGPLAGLPFQALPFGGVDLSGRVGTTSISYLPAASTAPLPDAPPPWTGPSAPALVVGAPAYDAAHGLRGLPGAAVEAEVIAALRGTKALLGVAADLTSVCTGLRNARIAHLATHGLLREQAPYSAELALAGDDSLTVPDLMGLDTTLDLAVLSACDSGRGRATAAGDLIGLTRALLRKRHAGADCVAVADGRPARLPDDGAVPPRAARRRDVPGPAACKRPGGRDGRSAGPQPGGGGRGVRDAAGDGRRRRIGWAA
jgi:CHAT domain-containing protein